MVGTARVLYHAWRNIIPQVQSEVPQKLCASARTRRPKQLVAAGEKLYNGAGGCTACHGLGTRAPNLLTDQQGTGAIGARCGKREAGKDCKAYLYEALDQPGAFVVPGFQPIMPAVTKIMLADADLGAGRVPRVAGRRRST